MYDCQELYSSTNNLWCFKWRYSRFQDSTLVSSQILMHQKQTNIDASKTKRVFDLKHINKNKKEIGLCVIINNNSGDQNKKQ